MSSTMWPCLVARVPIAAAMLPEPMMLMVVMECVPLSCVDQLVVRSCRRSDHGGATVENQLRAVDVARVVRCEEQSDRRDVVGNGQSLAAGSRARTAASSLGGSTCSISLSARSGSAVVLRFMRGVDLR